MIPSFSSNSTGVEIPQENGRGRSSFSRVFSYSLIAFFTLQVLIGIAVIFLYIGKEMKDMQMANVRSELSGRSQRLMTYLEDRLHILNDYSRLPVLVAGVMQPDDHLANTVDLVESLPFLKSEVLFQLQDFQGEYIYSRWDLDKTRITGFQELMDGSSEYIVDVVKIGGDGTVGYYWKLMVPVKYQGLAEGALSAYVPINLADIFPEVKGNVRISLVKDEMVLISRGSISEPSISLVSGTGFNGIKLQQSVSSKSINERIENMIIVLVVSLVVGSLVVVAVVQRAGRQFFLVPHERLQAMRDELEREVEDRTADLQRRTVQLSHEIKERREAELEARETGQLVSALLAGIGAAFLIIDPDTDRIVRSNSVARMMFGLDHSQFSETSCVELFTDYSESMTKLSCPASIEADEYEEGIAQHADGRQFPVSRFLVPMEIQGEPHIGVIMLDITERKALERRLNVAQKLESVGELASGVAHEINTPIQFIGDSIRFMDEATADLMQILKAEEELVRRCKESGKHADLIARIEELAEEADLEFILEEMPKACSRAQDGTDRVAKIVRAMKNFAHPGTGEMSFVDINQAIENTIMVSKNEWKYVADINTDFGSIPLVNCLPGDINQVILNILVNAAHAIGETIEASSGDKGTITILTEVSGDFMYIRIADTGPGIPREIRERVFDPFYTTKDVGKGTGQGLAIAHDIVVNRHGGTLDIESEIDKGATFIIGLPLNNDGDATHEA